MWRGRKEEGSQEEALRPVRADMGREPRAGRRPCALGPCAPGHAWTHGPFALRQCAVSSVPCRLPCGQEGADPPPKPRGPHRAHTSQGRLHQAPKASWSHHAPPVVMLTKARNRTRQRLSVEGCVSPHARRHRSHDSVVQRPRAHALHAGGGISHHARGDGIDAVSVLTESS